MNNTFRAIMALAITTALSACSQARVDQGDSGNRTRGSVIIFHAGSLSVPMKALADSFQIINPDARIILEPAGSVACARKIIDLKKTCDIMASSDYKVIENMLIPGYASWYIPFATNEMVIAYQKKSRLSGSVDSTNWTGVLLDPAVRYGRSDPNSDPCGYRTEMVIDLACPDPGLKTALLEKDRRFIRPKEVDLLALLEVGEVDYIFIYRSVADQHGLNYIVLSDEINLKDPTRAGHYASASVMIAGAEPGDSLRVSGEPMVYALTRLDSAPNAEAADAFLDFMLGPTGQAICRINGLPPLSGCMVTFYDKVPARLKHYVAQKD